jgi:glutaredoxin 3
MFGSSACPYTREMREWLEWTGREFDEYDVERDAEALERLQAVTGQSTVPVLLEDGEPVRIGWNGRGCFVGAGNSK